MRSVLVFVRSLALGSLSRAFNISMSMVSYILVSLICFTVALQAGEYGTRDDAVAMVKRVQDGFKKDGPEATFRAINAKRFLDRDLFPWVFRLDDGTNMANAPLPAVRSKNLIDLRDEDGKFVVRDWIRIASSPPYHGWSDYRWPDPGTGTVDQKSAWIERMGDYVVGVGVHKSDAPNENAVGIVSGSLGSDDTYVQIASDLADVLSNGDNLRIVPVPGIGGARNIRDVLSRKGIDIGLTQTSILNSFRRSNELMGQSNRIVYIAKLFNEEVHLVAGPGITSIEQLRGRKVNLDVDGSGTSYSMRGIFNTLGIDIQEVALPQRQALEKVKSGELAATAMISGKPLRVMSELSPDDGLHFVAVPYPMQLMDDYLPATLDHDDYPDLVAEGESVETVAVGTVLIAPDWPKTDEHYRRIERFVDTFFSKIDDFHQPTRHPKWREVNIATTLHGWSRFGAAQEWLDAVRAVSPHAEETDSTRTAAAPQAAAPADDETVPAGASQATGVANHDLDIDRVDRSSAPEKHHDVPSDKSFGQWLAKRHQGSDRADARTGPVSTETLPPANKPAPKPGTVTRSVRPLPSVACKRSKPTGADRGGAVDCDRGIRHVADGGLQKMELTRGDMPVESKPDAVSAGLMCLSTNSQACPILGDERHRWPSTQQASP